MEIKRMMNSEYIKIIVSQKEFNELARGLDWLISEGVDTEDLTSDMAYKDMREFVTNG